MGQFELEEGVVEACFLEGLAGLSGRGGKRRPARQSTKIRPAPRPSMAHEERSWNPSNRQQGQGPEQIGEGTWRTQSGDIIMA